MDNVPLLPRVLVKCKQPNFCISAITVIATVVPGEYRMFRVGQNHIYTACIGNFGLKITKYTVYIYVYIRFWPTLRMLHGLISGSYHRFVPSVAWIDIRLISSICTVRCMD